MKRRLMVLFLSLSAATVFAAGQKEKNAAPCGGFFYFLQGARPCGAPGFPLQFAASRAFSCGKAARFAPRRLLTQRFDSGRISGLLRICRLQRSILCLLNAIFVPARRRSLRVRRLQRGGLTSAAAAVFAGLPPSRQCFGPFPATFVPVLGGGKRLFLSDRRPVSH